MHEIWKWGNLMLNVRTLYETGEKVGKNLMHFSLMSHVVPYRDLKLQGIKIRDVVDFSRYSRAK